MFKLNTISHPPATATPATTATNVAKVATVAVAVATPAPPSATATRRAKVEAELRAHPELQRAFDVADAPLTAAPGEPVSVVLAVRHGDQILSGEIHIPRERWHLKQFLTTIDPAPATGRPS